MGEENFTDIVLIGAGIMSATLAALIKELEPEWQITVYEQLSTAGEESSNEWNNAGTGHSALCEMNYTTENADGTMNITKAVDTSEKFQLSRQFWSYLVKNGRLQNPKEFIMPLAHISLVEGNDNIRFLKKRYEAMTANNLFKGMEYTEDPAVMSKWAPLILKGRSANAEPLAMTYMKTGTDVNFGALSRNMFAYLAKSGVEVKYNYKVKDLKQNDDGTWQIKVEDLKTKRTGYKKAKFVFIGAGGGSLPLLQKSGIPEGRGIGGFPVSGLFLVCNNPAVVSQHEAKVYGKAKVGAPPMSVPHLDTRYIDGQKSLLFGPFAGFTPNFLKCGSYADLILSVRPHNIINMIMSAFKEFGLVKYLVQQLLLSDEKRLKELQEFVPEARLEDWEVVVAGQRVQVIEETKDGGKGTLQFGTKVVTSADGSIAALLGASPGASTAVDAMIDVLKKCFPAEFENWQGKIKEMIPSYGQTLADKPEFYQEIQNYTAEALELNK